MEVKVIEIVQNIARNRVWKYNIKVLYDNTTALIEQSIYEKINTFVNILDPDKEKKDIIILTSNLGSEALTVATEENFNEAKLEVMEKLEKVDEMSKLVAKLPSDLAEKILLLYLSEFLW